MQSGGGEAAAATPSTAGNVETFMTIKLWRQCLVTQRLMVLKILMSKYRGPRLTCEQVRSIHRVMSRSRSDRSLFMSWLSKATTQKDNTGSCFDLSVVADIFQNVVFVSGGSPSSEISMSGWKCFRTMFTLLNDEKSTSLFSAATSIATPSESAAALETNTQRTAEEEKKENDKHDTTMEVVVGLSELWDIVLHTKNSIISDEAAETLLEVCSRGIQKTGGSGKHVVEFLQKIFLTHLSSSSTKLATSVKESSNDQVTLRCLSLLHKFVKSSREAIATDPMLRLPQTLRLEKSTAAAWTFDKNGSMISPPPSPTRGGNNSPMQQKKESNELIAVPHGKSCRGSDITITVHGKYVTFFFSFFFFFFFFLFSFLFCSVGGGVVCVFFLLSSCTDSLSVVHLCYDL